MRGIMLISLLLAAGAASAQGVSERAQTWEFGFTMTHVDGWESMGEGGSSLEVSGETGWGLTGGYNFTNRLAVQFAYTSLSPRYSATYVPEDGGPSETIRHTASFDTLHIGGTVYIFPGRLTPFVQASVGWTNVDTNVISGPPSTGCWWDPWYPWWGPRCVRLYPTYGAREVSYSGTVGMRWDISSSLMLRAEYGMTVFDGNGLREREKPNTSRVTIGWKF